MPMAVTYHSSVDSSYRRTSQCALRNAAELAVEFSVRTVAFPALLGVRPAAVIPVKCP